METVSVRMVRALVLLCLLLAGAPTRVQAADDPVILPKVVLQAMPDGGIEAAAWTLDDRQIITASANARAILIWDADEGYIIDRVPMPRDALDDQATLRMLTGITITDDGNAALIDGIAFLI
ncbi:MAG: hypothetical protein RLZZ58_1595, partial [Pseudomonadota bacterium]